jgi:hypothetical protein
VKLNEVKSAKDGRITHDIVIVVSVCTDISFSKWSLRPKLVKDERLKKKAKTFTNHTGRC